MQGRARTELETVRSPEIVIRICKFALREPLADAGAHEVVLQSGLKHSHDSPHDDWSKEGQVSSCGPGDE